MSHEILYTQRWHQRMRKMIEDLQRGDIRFWRKRGKKEGRWQRVPPVTFAPQPIENLAGYLRRAKQLPSACLEHDLITALNLQGLTVITYKDRKYVRNMEAGVSG